MARETDPLHSQVVSLTRFNTGGNAYNVIPDVVKLGATYRSLTHEGMVNMKKRLHEVWFLTIRQASITQQIQLSELVLLAILLRHSYGDSQCYECTRLPCKCQTVLKKQSSCGFPCMSRRSAGGCSLT